MYIVTITKEERTKELLLKEEVTSDNIVDIVEQYFLSSQKDYADFYTDRLEYMKDVYYNINYSQFPNLWILYTNVRGYDTYDSGVFSAWTEERVREVAERKSRDFEGASIEVIGLYNSTKEEEICCSFNAG